MTSYEKSPKTYQVVDAIVEALSSQTPRDRYLVGVDARFLFSWMTLIPATVADTLTHHHRWPGSNVLLHTAQLQQSFLCRFWFNATVMYNRSWFVLNSTQIY